ncbi:MAG: peptidylprolyl isomerase, partial [Verrucomicrobiales bacterium]|nr:peptidylprolyl isomerase [Verrucomicrobiales bacterium]
KARHILVKTEAGLDGAGMAEKKAKIEAIRARLTGEKAEDFATVAKEASEGPSGPQGGDLGQFGRGQMVKEFDAAVFSQKVGEVGEPVKTQFGYHLILVEERNEAGGRVPLAEVSGKITEFLKGQQGQEVIGKFVDGLREKAEIEYID